VQLVGVVVHLISVEHVVPPYPGLQKHVSALDIRWQAPFVPHKVAAFAPVHTAAAVSQRAPVIPGLQTQVVPVHPENLVAVQVTEQAVDLSV